MTNPFPLLLKIKKTTKIGWWIATIIAILLPTLYVISWVNQGGELSNFDYWWILWRFYKPDGFSLNPFDWIFHNNEHLHLIPSWLYALNILLTKGSNIGLSYITIGLVLGQILLLRLMLPNSVKKSDSLFLFLTFCIAVFSFTPAAAHNWMRGFSGIIWISANLFVLIALFCAQKYAETLQKKWIFASILSGFLGYICHSSSLGIWVILCGFSLILKWPRKVIATYFSATILIGFIYFLTYQTPSHHPTLSRNLWSILHYIFVYLGAIFSHNIPIATWIGLGGFIISVILISYGLFYLQNDEKNSWFPWLGIQGHILVTALLTAISRAGFGIEQARSSRYASLPALFWLSLTVIVVLFIVQLPENFSFKNKLFAPLLGLFTILIILMYNLGGSVAQEIAERATYQPLVALSAQLGITDTQLIKLRVGNNPAAFIGLMDTLKIQGHVPFNREIKKENNCIPVGIQLDPKLLSKPQPSIPGYFDLVKKYTPTSAKVVGWIGDPSRMLHCIAILNQDNIVRGFAMSGFYRPDLGEQFGPGYNYGAWLGYTEILPGDKFLVAYASLKNKREWVALKNRQIIGPNSITVDSQ